MKKLLLVSIVTILPFCLFAGTFTSLVATGAWNASGSWTAVGDADGIPDADDDITIQAGHNITVTGTGHKGLNLIVDGTLTLNTSCNLTLWGNYTVNGTETGTNGSLTLKSTSGTISGSGSFGPLVRYSIVAANYTINAGVVILKSTQCSAGNGTITNNGYVKFAKIYGNAETWINNSGATLEFGSFDIASWLVTIDATAANNTVIYSNTPTAVNMKQPLGGIYHNLTVSGVSSAKKLTGNIQVNGNLLIISSGVINTQGFNISVRGNVSKFGAIVFSGTSTFTFNGTSAQSLSGGTSGLAFINLVFDNPTTVTFSALPWTVSNSLSVLQGTAVLGTNNLTLLSNAASTAFIGQSAGTITGSIRMQRFISARAAGYSDMAGSVVGQTLADWDDELLMVYTYAPPSAFPSVFGYDETSFDYVPITSATQTLDAGVGFEVYLDSDGLQTTFNATTIINTGTPTIGDVDMSGYVTFNNDGWNLLGNPYHANLSWDALHATTTDISTDIMFFDETIDNGDGTFGDFVTVSTGSGVLIAPNQGFWVNVTGGSPSFTFTEAIKSNSNSSTFRYKEEEMFTLKAKMLENSKYASKTHFRFSTNPETATKGNLSAKKMAPRDLSPLLCSQTANNKDLKINLVNSTENNITIPVKFKANVDGIYVIESQNTAMAVTEGYNCITLFDSKLNRTVDIANENYQFYAEVGEADNRFTLVLSKNGDCRKSESLVVNSDEVDINRIGDNTLVKLNFENETSVSISVTDLLGQKITPTQVIIASQQDVYMPIPADFRGIYMVTVSYNNKIETRKLYK
jgi:hypothetical protein